MRKLHNEVFIRKALLILGAFRRFICLVKMSWQHIRVSRAKNFAWVR